MKKLVRKILFRFAKPFRSSYETLFNIYRSVVGNHRRLFSGDGFDSCSSYTGTRGLDRRPTPGTKQRRTKRFGHRTTAVGTKQSDTRSTFARTERFHARSTGVQIHDRKRSGE